MPVRAVFAAQYLTEGVAKMRGHDFDATLLVKATKGLDLPPTQYVWRQIDGVNTRINHASRDRGMDWFAQWAAPRVAAVGQTRKVLVPIPSSSSTADADATYRTKLIADRIAARLGEAAIVAPSLRFRAAMPPSRQGGTRDIETLRRNMHLTAPLPTGMIILVDDVLTTGAHVAAASRLIAESDRQTPLAVICGRTLHHQLDDPFVVADEMIDEPILF